jgi:hypothetical protein
LVVVSRYLADPAPFEDYLSKCDDAAEKIRQRIEASQSPQSKLRELLLTRAREKGLLRDQAGA